MVLKSNCKKFGRQSWLIISIIITEFLLVLKFDWRTVTKPIPQPVASVWVVGLVTLLVWTIVKFYILRDVKNDVPAVNGKPGVKGAERNGDMPAPHSLAMELRPRPKAPSHLSNNNNNSNNNPASH
ncbi:hypothetical protein ACOMHN_027682 [Nucella lapillus]